MKKLISVVLVLSLLASLFMVVPASAASMFTDVEGHWAKDTIISLASKGIINGKGNGIYDPQGTVTRAEFMKLLVCALGEEDSAAKLGKNALADVNESDWFYAYIASGINNGVLNVSDLNKSQFAPNEGMTRGNVAIWMTNGLGISSNEVCTFSDVTLPAEKEAVATASAEGLVAGYDDNTYRPGNTLTRAEAAVIVERVMKKHDELNNLRQSENKVYMDENVAEIKDDGGKNILKSVDEATKKATFINCTEEFKKLKVGQVLYIQPSATNPDGVLLKIGAITADGDTVVIDCLKPELSEIFNKIDISQEIPVSADDYVEGSSDAGISLVTKPAYLNGENEMLIADASTEKLLAFEIKESGSKNIAEVEKDFKITEKFKSELSSFP